MRGPLLARVVAASALLLVTAPASAIGPGPASPFDDCRDMIQDNRPYEGDRSRLVSTEVAGVSPAAVPVNVLLPPGYDAPGNTRRYPVFYLLTAWHDEDSWLVYSDLYALSNDPEAARQAIVVMPRGHGFLIDIDQRNGSWLWETFYVERLVPFVDANFRTIPDGAHRAVAGPSGGGITAMHLASRHPDIFRAVGGFSGGYDFADPGAGSAAAIFSDRAIWACSGGRVGDEGVFGDPVLDRVWYYALSPEALARNLKGVSVYFSYGDGRPCDAGDVADIAIPPNRTMRWANLLEPAVYESSEQFRGALTEAGIPHTADYYGCGLHSWGYFDRDLHVFWDFMFEVFGSPEPAEFDYRTADAPNNRTASNGRRLLIANRVWGWTFDPDPDRATEFLDVTDASEDGVTLTGSGLTTVTTAAIFSTGQIVGLTGALESSTVADEGGRITFHVDLGPPHAYQQYSPQQRGLEAAGGYWTTKAVQFDVEGRG